MHLLVLYHLDVLHSLHHGQLDKLADPLRTYTRCAVDVQKEARREVRGERGEMRVKRRGDVVVLIRTFAGPARTIRKRWDAVGGGQKCASG